LSVTLRDAQHLCWKNFRMINDKLDPKRGKLWTPLVLISDLLEEANRLGSTVKSLEDCKTLEKPDMKKAIATELSDLLYMIFVLAEQYRIELEESFLETVNDYMLKFVK